MKTKTNTEFPETEIQATVSTNILKKAHLLFNQSPATILYELLQNSRRANATQIDVEILSIEPEKCQIRFLDNGNGISNPKSLLELGGSNWQEDIEKNETPAGMGFFSLCHLPTGVEVRSNNWSMHLTPEVFSGNTKVKIKKAHNLTGTQLVFQLSKGCESVIAILKNCCEFYPVPVRINKETAKQNSYLKNCSKTKTIDGAVLGITSETTGINFYGLVLKDSYASRDYNPLPFNFPFNIRVDVLNNAAIDLVLPARSSIIKNHKWDTIKAEARRFAYECIRDMDIPHSIDFQHWKEAKTMGIELPEATAYMFAKKQDSCKSSYIYDPFDTNLDKINLTKLPAGQTIAICELSKSETLAYYMAIHPRKKGEPRNNTLPIPLRHDQRMEGYSWYPKAKILSLNFQAKRKGETLTWTPTDNELPEGLDACKRKNWPEEISAVIEISGLSDTQGTQTKTVPVPMGFCEDEEYDNESHTLWVLTKKTTPKQLNFDLCTLLKSIYFCESDGSESDSLDTQTENFDETIDNMLEEIFVSVTSRNIKVVNGALKAWDVQNALNSIGFKNLALVQNANGQIQIIKKK